MGRALNCVCEGVCVGCGEGELCVLTNDHNLTVQSVSVLSDTNRVQGIYPNSVHSGFQRLGFTVYCRYYQWRLLIWATWAVAQGCIVVHHVLKRKKGCSHPYCPDIMPVHSCDRKGRFLLPICVLGALHP